MKALWFDPDGNNKGRGSLCSSAPPPPPPPAQSLLYIILYLTAFSLPGTTLYPGSNNFANFRGGCNKNSDDEKTCR